MQHRHESDEAHRHTEHNHRRNLQTRGLIRVKSQQTSRRRRTSRIPGTCRRSASNGGYSSRKTYRKKDYITHRQSTVSHRSIPASSVRHDAQRFENQLKRIDSIHPIRSRPTSRFSSHLPIATPQSRRNHRIASSSSHRVVNALVLGPDISLFASFCKVCQTRNLILFRSIRSIHTRRRIHPPAHSSIHREMKRQTSGGRRPGPLRVSAVGVVFTATMALAASVASGFVLEIKNDAEECVYSVRMTTRDA